MGLRALLFFNSNSAEIVFIRQILTYTSGLRDERVKGLRAALVVFICFFYLLKHSYWERTVC